MNIQMTSQPVAGVTELEGGLYRFGLYAPGKRGVSLVGSFNDWDEHEDPLKEIENGIWSCERHLERGEQAYQYIVDGVRICDPYAPEIRWPRGNTPDNIPPINAIPEGILHVGAPEYLWRHEDWHRPDWRDLTLCEINIGDFTEEGTFTGVMRRLDYLRELGVTALVLMPVYEMVACEEWGPQPFGFFACHRSYGTAMEFKRLVDETHGHGIGIIIDLVLSHTSARHSFTRLYSRNESPWYGEPIGIPNRFNMPSFDHRKPAIKTFCQEIQSHWLREYHVDGFRYTHATSIGVEGHHGMPYLVEQARAILSKAYLMAERLPDSASAIRQCGLDGTWYIHASHIMRTLALQRDVAECAWADFRSLITSLLDPMSTGYPSTSCVINAIDTHDKERLIHCLLNEGCPPDEARRRVLLAATILMTAPGVPMVYQGEEFGDFSSRNATTRNPLAWDMLATQGARALLEHFQRMIRLRREHPALRGDTCEISRIDPHNKCIAFRRWARNGDQVVVAANFSNDTRVLAVPLPETGMWEDLMIGRQFNQIKGGETVELELQGQEAAVLVKLR